MSVKIKGFGRSLGWLAGAVLAAASTVAHAQSDNMGYTAATESDTTPSSGAIMMDLFLVRPLSIAGTALSTGIFVVGLPFEALGGDVSGPAHRLVAEPAKYTFVRPLGQN
jgi:hypothetical protein